MVRGLMLWAASAGAICFASNAYAQGDGRSDATACAALKDFHPDSWTTVVAATLIAPPYKPTDQSPAMTKPFCRVQAVTRPEPNSNITFEVWLPLRAAWNGRFQGIGGGGVSGMIIYDGNAAGTRRGLEAAVEAGFAAVSTDNGHRLKTLFDQTWAIHQPDKVVDFGFRAIHVTTVAGKAITTAFYKRNIDYSYWIGCSQGGGKGLMNAQRWPNDYNGILAGAPVAQWTRAMAGITAGALAQMRSPATFIPESKRMLIHNEVMKQCDGVDGLVDGVLTRPDKCHFDVTKIECKGTVNGQCITREQARALMATYAGATRRNGERLTDGYSLGSELEWPFLGQSGPGNVWGGFWGGLVFEDERYDLLSSLDLEADYDFARKKLGWALDADNPDLAPFARAGGKLLVFHGEADQLISPRVTAEYYRDVQGVIGADKTDDFFQFFLVPSMNHCRGGIGPDTFDLLPALQAWVEKGIRPDNLVATKIVDSRIVRSRPLCPFPSVAMYKGKGDINQAESFECKPRD